MDRRRLYLILSANILSHTGTGITMLAIPWILANQPGGKKIFGDTIIAVTLLSMFILPYAGSIVDRFSRKRVLMGVALFGWLVTFAFACFLWDSTANVIALIALYATGNIVYNFHFPALFAWVQELFEPEHYRKINGLMEVQGQFAMMAAGGLGALLIEKISLATILMIDALSYLASFILFTFIFYTPKETKQTRKSKWTDIFTGFVYLYNDWRRGLFLFGSLVPFIIVLVSNYLFPIHVKQTLEAGAATFGGGEISWAAGAILSGLLIPLWLKYSSPAKVILWMFFSYCLCIWAHSFNPFAWIFIVICFFMGAGNAAIRVARNTVIMEIVDHNTIGRVNTALMTLGNILKIILILIFTRGLIDFTTFQAFAILGIISSLVFFVVLFCRVDLK